MWKSVLALLLAAPTARSFTHRALRQTPSFTALASWKPCAQPRFDEFASYTVGPWITAEETPQKDEVEEVMRTCGGAVQGIRELPLSVIGCDSTSGERTYHNRADGGFVYFDDGSYSAGPERWDWSVADGSAGEKHMMASLAFPDRRRAWLALKLAEASEAARDCNSLHQLSGLRMLELSRPISSDDGRSNNNNLGPVPSTPPGVRWEEIHRVRMPNANQDWSLARAKWEKQVVESNENEGAPEEAPTDSKGQLMGWSFIESIPQGQENELFGDAITDVSLNLHMLAICPTKQIARSVVRCYDGTGSLKAVAFLTGSLS